MDVRRTNENQLHFLFLTYFDVICDQLLNSIVKTYLLNRLGAQLEIIEHACSGRSFASAITPSPPLLLTNKKKNWINHARF